MGPYSEIVYNGYLRVPDREHMPRAYGLDHSRVSAKGFEQEPFKSARQKPPEPATRPACLTCCHINIFGYGNCTCRRSSCAQKKRFWVLTCCPG